jgi:hypothetical protein
MATFKITISQELNTRVEAIINAGFQNAKEPLVLEECVNIDPVINLCVYDAKTPFAVYEVLDQSGLVIDSTEEIVGKFIGSFRMGQNRVSVSVAKDGKRGGPSIRLDNSIRGQLMDLAYERFEDADLLKAELASWDKAKKLLIRDIKGRVSKSETKVLEKFGFIRSVSEVEIEAFQAEIDGKKEIVPAPYSALGVKLRPFNARRDWSGAISQLPNGYCMSDTGLYYGQNSKVELGVEVPFVTASTNGMMVRWHHKKPCTITDIYGKSEGELTDETTEALRQAMLAGRARWHKKIEMLRAAAMLLSKARTFEQVVEVWPEAEELVAEAKKRTMLPVLLTPDLNVLFENMKKRGVATPKA